MPVFRSRSSTPKTPASATTALGSVFDGSGSRRRSVRLAESTSIADVALREPSVGSSSSTGKKVKGLGIDLNLTYFNQEVVGNETIEFNFDFIDRLESVKVVELKGSGSNLGIDLNTEIVILDSEDSEIDERRKNEHFCDKDANIGDEHAYFGQLQEKRSGRKRRSSTGLSSVASQEKMETGYMSLRSGLKITRRSLDLVDDDPVHVGKSVGVEMLDSSMVVGTQGSRVCVEVDGGGKRRFTVEEKGKGKLVVQERNVKEVEMEQVEGFELVENRKIAVGIHITEGENEQVPVTSKRKLSSDEKGKCEVVIEEEDDDNLEEFASDMEELLTAVGGELHNGDEHLNPEMSGRANNLNGSHQPMSRRDADKNRAIKAAPRFAYFKTASEDMEEGSDDDNDDLKDGSEEGDWPGPFSTALKIIEERERKLMAPKLNAASNKVEACGVKIRWKPSGVQKQKPYRTAPSLKDLCLKVLAENADEIESLDGVPDPMRHALVSLICKSRKMNSHMLGLLLTGSPSEVLLNDCSWASEQQMEDVLAKCNIDNLKILQLDLSGRCLPDYVLRATLARAVNCLPSLTVLSLRGAYRLSDDGLNALASAAPSLRSINLCQCSIITSHGITNLTNRLNSVLRELYLDDCQDVDALTILPGLKKLNNLEVLSMARIGSVCNKFIRLLIPSCGQNIRELGFAGCDLLECRKLSGASLKIIGEYCSKLDAIDLHDLQRINDASMGYLANGCRSIKKLKLGGTLFCDEAIAAFLEASGGSLAELSLNSMQKVAQQTAIAISRRCSSTLRNLDLSFCRKMNDEALGLIVDSCSNLQLLKIFGCTQITDVFINGHTNALVKIIGLKGSILEKMDAPAFS